MIHSRPGRPKAGQGLVMMMMMMLVMMMMVMVMMMMNSYGFYLR